MFDSITNYDFCFQLTHPRYTVNPESGTLTITRVKAEDSGHYTCITSNYAGKVEANFTLQVYLFAIFITLTALEPNLLPKNRMCFKITL